MRTRYLTNVALGVLGGFLLVTSQAFAVSTFEWLMLASGIAAISIAVCAAALTMRGGQRRWLAGGGALQRSIDCVCVLLGAWTIVASLVFGGAAVTWLGFASGAAFAVFALAGLTVHELSTERVVHALAVHTEVPAGPHSGVPGSRDGELAHVS